MAWEDITDVLTPEGAHRVQVGQVLMFRFEGSRNDLRVMRKSRGKVWAKLIETHSPDEVIVTDDSGSRRLA